MLDKFVNVLPIIITVESFLAAIPLACAGRWGSAVYWFSAGMVTTSAMLIHKYG